jgi:hypothetical protein
VVRVTTTDPSRWALIDPLTVIYSRATFRCPSRHRDTGRLEKNNGFSHIYISALRFFFIPQTKITDYFLIIVLKKTQRHIALHTDSFSKTMAAKAQ